MAITADCGTWNIIDWPFPRAFFLKYYTLAFNVADYNICQGGGASTNTVVLFELVYSAGSWTAYPVATVGTYNGSINHFDIADFGPYYIVSVGSTLDNAYSGNNFERDPEAAVAPGAVTEISNSSVHEFMCCCNFRNQLVVGGILTSITYAGYDNWEALGNSHIAWSGIGKLTFKPDEDRTAGFMRVPWAKGDTGKVIAIKTIADRVMVFGDFGFMGMEPYSTKLSVGFSERYIKGSGITHNSHVAGDEHVLCFVDNNNDLCLTQDGQKVEVLGYREFMEDMDNDNLIITYVPQKKRFFISDGTLGYCLTEYGLYKVNQLVTSAGMSGDGYVGFYDDNEDYQLRLETNTSDFNQRGKKTLETVQVGAEYNKTDEKLELSTKYKNDYTSSTFTQTNWKRLNNSGVAFPIITADEFRICLRGGDYRNSVANISYIKGSIKIVDKRAIRGMYSVD